MSLTNGSSKKSSKIIGIQFSILSPEEIEKVLLLKLQIVIHILIINQLLEVYLIHEWEF